MKPWLVHYMNKYPRGVVDVTEDAIDVYCVGGLKRVALRKNGAGQWIDQSKDLGCMDQHDLAPIPKDSRVFKLFPDGRVDFDERYVERLAIQEELAAIEIGGQDRVPSIAQILRSENPGVDVSRLDTNFEYSKWPARRAGRVSPPPAPPMLSAPSVEAGLTIPPQLAAQPGFADKLREIMGMNAAAKV